MKACTRCNRELPIEEFRVSVKRGKPYTYPHCNDCQRRYVREHYENNKQVYADKARTRNNRVRTELKKMISRYLLQHPCVDCGEADPIVLEFDHIDRTAKIADVSRMISTGNTMESILAEMAKCEVRCCNCHRRRTASQMAWNARPL